MPVPTKTRVKLLIKTPKYITSHPTVITILPTTNCNLSPKKSDK